MGRKKRKTARAEEEIEGTRSRSGFTLIEILVVLSILAALAALLLPVLRYARVRADRSVTRQEIARLSLGIENFADQDPFADWPPADLERLGISGDNKINGPNESLVICLGTRRGEGPYFDFDAARFTNLDSDSAPSGVLKEKFRLPAASSALNEYVDLWGNPYVYFPYRAYGKTFTYLDGEGEPFEARLEKDAASEAYPSPMKFVIWSCGPDGINDNGGGDDIASWR